MSTYLPPSSMSTDASGEAKNNGNSGPVNPSADESEKSTRTELPSEENTDSGNNGDFSSAEQKTTLLSSNDGSSHPQQINVEQQEEKRRDPHSVGFPRSLVHRKYIFISLESETTLESGWHVSRSMAWGWRGRFPPPARSYLKFVDVCSSST